MTQRAAWDRFLIVTLVTSCSIPSSRLHPFRANSSGTRNASSNFCFLPKHPNFRVIKARSNPPEVSEFRPASPQFEHLFENSLRVGTPCDGAHELLR